MPSHEERYAADESEAIERAKKWRERDPYEGQIEPSLLSSNEIAKYVKDTAMLFPFYEEDLKTASYAVKFGTYAYEFNKSGGYLMTNLGHCPGGLLKLPANSIVFVQCGTHFRLPKYMALRFNLRIKHVHRGLLLGTGPLVDPGFDGELLIPLHNLTSKDHFVDVNSHVIWVEFTKTTYRRPDKSDLVNFDSSKTNLTAREYLDAARKSLVDGEYLPIESSINGLMEKSIETANKAIKTAKRTEKTLWGFGIASVVGVAIAVMGFLYTFVQATYEQVDEVRHIMSTTAADSVSSAAVQADIGGIVATNEELKLEIGRLETEFALMSSQVDRLLSQRTSSNIAE
ncbi:hypothetical protein [Devosia sp.]|uniref:hypothetical protein n=1 Tax=Devosia sp. TaxID=1871048 RepID=UPI0019DF80A6|nr:hypothetical protein [Devosia sp.]MBE0580149.1 hypothetical protein [Devosia sp.]